MWIRLMRASCPAPAGLNPVVFCHAKCCASCGWLRRIELSTVRLPLEEMGEIAAGLVLDAGGDEARTVRVAGEVVLRASTAHN